jgi:hypothetical protein
VADIEGARTGRNLPLLATTPDRQVDSVPIAARHGKRDRLPTSSHRLTAPEQGAPSLPSTSSIGHHWFLLACQDAH